MEGTWTVRVDLDLVLDEEAGSIASFDGSNEGIDCIDGVDLGAGVGIGVAFETTVFRLDGVKITGR